MDEVGVWGRDWLRPRPPDDDLLLLADAEDDRPVPCANRTPARNNKSKNRSGAHTLGK